MKWRWLLPLVVALLGAGPGDDEIERILLEGNLLEMHEIGDGVTHPMKVTLAAWFVPMTLLTIGLIMELYSSSRRRWQKELDTPADTSWAMPQPTGQAPADSDESPPSEANSV